MQATHYSSLIHVFLSATPGRKPTKPIKHRRTPLDEQGMRTSNSSSLQTRGAVEWVVPIMFRLTLPIFGVFARLQYKRSTRENGKPRFLKQHKIRLIVNVPCVSSGIHQYVPSVAARVVVVELPGKWKLIVLHYHVYILDSTMVGWYYYFTLQCVFYVTHDGKISAPNRRISSPIFS